MNTPSLLDLAVQREAQLRRELEELSCVKAIADAIAILNLSYCTVEFLPQGVTFKHHQRTAQLNYEQLVELRDQVRRTLNRAADRLLATPGRSWGDDESAPATPPAAVEQQPTPNPEPSDARSTAAEDSTPLDGLPESVARGLEESPSTMMDPGARSKAYMAGREHAMRGGARKQPWKAGTTEAEQWALGFDEAKQLIEDEPGFVKAQPEADDEQPIPEPEPVAKAKAKVEADPTTKPEPRKLF